MRQLSSHSKADFSSGVCHMCVPGGCEPAEPAGVVLEPVVDALDVLGQVGLAGGLEVALVAAVLAALAQVDLVHVRVQVPPVGGLELAQVAAEVLRLLGRTQLDFRQMRLFMLFPIILIFL